MKLKNREFKFKYLFCYRNGFTFDLFSKTHKQSLHEFLGITTEKKKLISSMTLGIKSLDLLKSDLEKYIQWPVLKIKMSANLVENLEKIKFIRNYYNGNIRIDNGSWDRTKAIFMLTELKDYNIEFIEQPIAPQQHELLRELNALTEIPIFVDEDC